MRVASAATQSLVGEGVCAGYGSIPVLRGVDLHVPGGEIVTLLGPNGAGKTTLLMALAGLLPLQGGRVTLNGEALVGPLHKRSKRGLGFVSEQRCVFPSISVRDNLRMAGGDLDSAVGLFPELQPLLQRRVGLLSGGQQQMLALGRALSGRPSVLLVDELSLGLAPVVVARLLDAIRTAADAGAAILMVEQHARAALDVADRAYLLRRGEMVMSGPSSEVKLRMDEVERAYLA